MEDIDLRLDAVFGSCFNSGPVAESDIASAEAELALLSFKFSKSGHLRTFQIKIDTEYSGIVNNSTRSWSIPDFTRHRKMKERCFLKAYSKFSR